MGIPECFRGSVLKMWSFLTDYQAKGRGIMNVDQCYPALASLAATHGRTLSELEKCSHSKGESFLSLGDCLSMVAGRWPTLQVGGPHHYLATLETCLGRLPPEARDGFWHKLNTAPSGFLDTVVEATWAIYFWDRGVLVAVEEPFDRSNGDGKNADFVVSRLGKKYWLDAKCIHPSQSHNSPSRRPETKERVIHFLATEARRRYREKFSGAEKSGQLGDSSAGVLLCVHAFEPSVIPPLLSDILDGTKLPAPPCLFDWRHPNFGTVCVHTIRPRGDSLLLGPVCLGMWTRSESDGLDWLLK